MTMSFLGFMRLVYVDRGLVEPPAHGVEVDRPDLRVHAVRQQNVNPPALPVDPDRRSGETRVADRRLGKSVDRRARAALALPEEAARLGKIGSSVVADLAGRAEPWTRELPDVFRGSEQARVRGDAAAPPRVPVVYFPADRLRAEAAEADTELFAELRLEAVPAFGRHRALRVGKGAENRSAGGGRRDLARERAIDRLREDRLEDLAEHERPEVAVDDRFARPRLRLEGRERPPVGVRAEPRRVQRAPGRKTRDVGREMTHANVLETRALEIREVIADRAIPLEPLVRRQARERRRREDLRQRGEVPESILRRVPGRLELDPISGADERRAGGKASRLDLGLQEIAERIAHRRGAGTPASASWRR